jgi:hypothetical protein
MDDVGMQINIKSSLCVVKKAQEILGGYKKAVIYSTES